MIDEDIKILIAKARACPNDEAIIRELENALNKKSDPRGQLIELQRKARQLADIEEKIKRDHFAWIEEINNRPSDHDLYYDKVKYNTQHGFIVELTSGTLGLTEALKHPKFNDAAVDTLIIETLDGSDLANQPILASIKHLTLSGRDVDERFRWYDSTYDYEANRLSIFNKIITSPYIRNLESIDDKDDPYSGGEGYWHISELIAQSTNLPKLNSVNFTNATAKKKFLEVYEKALEKAIEHQQQPPLPSLERVNGDILPDVIITLRKRVIPTMGKMLLGVENSGGKWAERVRPGEKIEPQQDKPTPPEEERKPGNGGRT